MRVWLFVLDCLLQRFLLLHPQLPTAVQKSPQVSSGQKIKPAYKNTFRNFKFTYLLRHMCSSIWEDSPNTNLFIVLWFFVLWFKHSMQTAKYELQNVDNYTMKVFCFTFIFKVSLWNLTCWVQKSHYLLYAITGAHENKKIFWQLTS